MYISLKSTESDFSDMAVLWSCGW